MHFQGGRTVEFEGWCIMHGSRSRNYSKEQLTRRRAAFKLQCLATATFSSLVLLFLPVSFLHVAFTISHNNLNDEKSYKSPE